MESARSANRERRPLSLHQHSFVARHNIGIPVVLSIAVTYPNRASAPTLETLATRIDEMGQHYPVLVSDLKGHDTLTPFWEERDQPWPSTDILFERFSTEVKPVNLFAQEVAEMERDKLGSKPLWKVTVHSNPNNPQSLCSILLTMNHIVTDGKGLEICLQELLAESIAAHPYEKLSGIKNFEDTVNPSETSKPSVPRPPHWPQERPKQPLIGAPSSVVAWAVDHHTMENLKLVGRQKNIPHLNPTLTAASLVALWHTLKDKANPPDLSVYCARSERNHQIGHAYCTGIYVAGAVFQAPTLNATDEFWPLASAVSHTLASQEAQDAVRRYVLSLRDTDPKVPEENTDSRVKSGWEAKALQSVSSDYPFAASIFISNLAKTQLPPNAQFISWYQTAPRTLGAWTINLIGHSRLDYTAEWMQDVALEDSEGKQAAFAFREILVRLSQSGLRPGLTLGQLVDGMRTF